MSFPAPPPRWRLIFTWSDPETNCARESAVEVEADECWKVYREALRQDAIPRCPHSSRVLQVAPR